MSFDLGSTQAPDVPGTRLLPGEDRCDFDLRDAEHWVRVYEELAALPDHLLRASNRGAAPGTRCDRTDLWRLSAHLHRRLALWQDRRDRLAGEAGSSAARARAEAG